LEIGRIRRAKVSIEKSEIIKSTYQRFGQKIEDIETNRKSAMSECLGAVDILKKMHVLCEAHKKQAYAEEQIKEKGLTLTAVEYIKQGINEIQEILLNTIHEREDASVLYRGQMQALGNVIQMLGKEFESEEQKIKQEMDHKAAVDRGEVPEDTRRRGQRPLGVRPEKVAGNPNIGQNKPVSQPISEVASDKKSKKKPKKDNNATDKSKS